MGRYPRKTCARCTMIDQTGGFVAGTTDAQKAHTTFINIGRDFDWLQFFQGCHPSPAGHRMIAANVARAVAPLLVTDRPAAASFEMYNGSNRKCTPLSGHENQVTPISGPRRTSADQRSASHIPRETHFANGRRLRRRTGVWISASTSTAVAATKIWVE
jgi:hypothetical protein